MKETGESGFRMVAQAIVFVGAVAGAQLAESNLSKSLFGTLLGCILIVLIIEWVSSTIRDIVIGRQKIAIHKARIRELEAKINASDSA